jgi:predicted RND superfamily exporter protein
MTYTGRATVASMIQSYLLAFLLITPLMIALIGSLRAGLVSMIPNLVPIALTLGLMVLVDIKLDIFTLLVGCIVVGLAVDDTIHFIHSFRRELARTGDPVVSIHQTLQTTGRALLFTTIILCCGFLVFILSSMNNLSNFGILVSFALAAAFLLDVVATPALLLLVTRHRADDVAPEH